MNAGASLAALAVAFFGWGIIIAGGAIAIERAAGPSWLWRACLLFVVVVTVAGTIAFHRSFPEGAGTVLGTVYVLGVFVGGPTAAAAFAASRHATGTDQVSLGRHMGRSYLAYLVATPPALVLGALPDILRAF